MSRCRFFVKDIFKIRGAQDCFYYFADGGPRKRDWFAEIFIDESHEKFGDEPDHPVASESNVFDPNHTQPSESGYQLFNTGSNLKE